MKKSFVGKLALLSLIAVIAVCGCCHAEEETVTFISSTGITRLEAEDFMQGGQDVSWHETTYETADVYQFPSAPRPSDPNDSSTFVPQTAVSADGGYYLTYATDPEWVKYQVEVEKSGVYAVGAYCARGYDGGSLTLVADDTGDKVTIPYTALERNDWSFGRTKGEFLINLAEGTHVLTLQINWPWDIDYLLFVPMSEDTAISYDDSEPNLDPEYVTSISGETTRLEMENWMNGGNGVAFNEDDYTAEDTYAHPRAPRPSNANQLVPQTRLAGDNNYVIIYMQDPDWMKFKVDIEEGTYAISAFAGSNWSVGNISLYLDDEEDPFAILPASSLKEFDWTLQMTSKSVADLPAGEHIIKVSVYGPFDLDYIEFTKTE